jgi:aminobenzoyl-glutamate utilization protein B
MSAAEHLQDFFQQQSPRMAALADSIWSLAELRYA